MYELFIKLFFLACFISRATASRPNCERKHGSPAEALCGVKGTDKGNFQCQQIVRDRHECAIMCSQQALEGCKSFKYDSTSRRCWISNNQVAKYIDQTGEDGYSYYDIRCFNCPDPCRDQIVGGGNLLFNGHFSHQRICPWHVRQPFNYTGIPRTPHSSGRSIHWDDYPGEVYQSYNTCPGNTYLYVFDWMGRARKNIYDDFDLNMVAFDYVGNGYYRSAEERSLSSYAWTYNYYHFVRKRDWTRAYGFMKLGAEDGTSFPLAGMQDRYDGRASYSLANVGVYRMPDVQDMKVKPDSNVIVNGNFETGVAKPWSTQGQVVSPGIGSKYGLRLIRKNYRDVRLEQDITVKPHTPYLLTLKVRGLVIKRKERLVMSSDAERASLSILDFPNGPGNYSFAVPVAMGRTRAKLKIQFNPFPDETIESDAIFDDIRLEEISNLPFPFNN